MELEYSVQWISKQAGKKQVVKSVKVIIVLCVIVVCGFLPNTAI